MGAGSQKTVLTSSDLGVSQNFRFDIGTAVGHKARQVGL